MEDRFPMGSSDKQKMNSNQNQDCKFQLHIQHKMIDQSDCCTSQSHIRCMTKIQMTSKIQLDMKNSRIDLMMVEWNQ